MATPWKVTVKILNEESKLASIRVVRTDPVTDEVWPYACMGIIRTNTQRKAIIAKIKSRYRKHIAEKVVKIDIISGFDATVANDLNDWDVTL